MCTYYNNKPNGILSHQVLVVISNSENSNINVAK